MKVMPFVIDLAYFCIAYWIAKESVVAKTIVLMSVLLIGHMHIISEKETEVWLRNK